MAGSPAVFFNCAKCPAFCCSYEHVQVLDSDLERLARHFGLSRHEAERRFTKRGDAETPRVMRHKSDEIFGSVCRFLDGETRRCTIYEARPRICRAYPGTSRCGFYDFLSSERRAQGDPEHVPDFRR